METVEVQGSTQQSENSIEPNVHPDPPRMQYKRIVIFSSIVLFAIILLTTIQRFRSTEVKTLDTTQYPSALDTPLESTVNELPDLETQTDLPDDGSTVRDSIPLTDTSTWQTVTAYGVTFDIPPGYRTEQSNDGSNIVSLYAPDSPFPTHIRVEPYQGGSRRTQWLGTRSAQECDFIFTEAQFGKLSALQIAYNPEKCQGGYDGGRVVVIADKLVSVGELPYDVTTKEITRYPVLDTITSTLQ